MNIEAFNKKHYGGGLDKYKCFACQDKCPQCCIWEQIKHKADILANNMREKNKQIKNNKQKHKFCKL